jgi:hypothetical protein
MYVTVFNKRQTAVMNNIYDQHLLHKLKREKKNKKEKLAQG